MRIRRFFLFLPKTWAIMVMVGLRFSDIYSLCFWARRRTATYGLPPVPGGSLRNGRSTYQHLLGTAGVSIQSVSAATNDSILKGL
jgi:hypothetical protein